MGDEGRVELDVEYSDGVLTLTEVATGQEARIDMQPISSRCISAKAGPGGASVVMSIDRPLFGRLLYDEIIKAIPHLGDEGHPAYAELRQLAGPDPSG